MEEKVGEQSIVSFFADGIAIKPPHKVNDTVIVEILTGIHALSNLQRAFIWQGERNEERGYEITIRKL